MRPEERAEIEKQLDRIPRLRQAIEIDQTVIDEWIVSVCFDSGLYFAACLQREIPELKWTYRLKPKSNADVGQPVLVAANPNLALNPRRVMEVLAAKYSMETGMTMHWIPCMKPGKSC